MTQLSTHLKSLEHFLNSPEKATYSVLLEEVGYPTAVATPPTVDTPILHCLVAVNEFIQLFVHLAKASQAMYNLRRENVSDFSSNKNDRILFQYIYMYLTTQHLG